MKILIIKLSAIGDVIHTLPSLNALRTHFPDARIDWVVEEAAFPIIEGHRALDRIIVSGRKRWLRQIKGQGKKNTIREIRTFFRALRQEEYDWVIDFQALLKSGILAALARGKQRIGFGRGMEHMEQSHIFFNKKIPAVDMEIHAILRSLMLLEKLGVPHRDIVYDLPVRKEDRNAAEALIEKGLPAFRGPLLAVNPMAKWITKLWRSDRFAQLADRLVEKAGAGIIFTGSSEDAAEIGRIRSMMRMPSLNLAGKTSLKTLVAVYERCDALITTDTGPMHLAAAAGIPVTAIFGPTAPRRTGPFGPGHQVVRANVPCSPCFKRQCPRGMECMEEILVSDVEKALEKIGIM